MNQLVADISTTVCVLAALLGCARLPRTWSRSSSFAALVVAFLALATWAAVVSLYVRSPFSALRAHVLLAALCLVHGPWLLATLALREASLRATWLRWKFLLLVQAGACALAASLIWWRGVDWVTGIANEPTVVLTTWGAVSVTLAAVPSFVALIVVATDVVRSIAITPAVLVGTVGGVGGLLWLSGVLLWRGYLAATPLTSSVALQAAAAAVWAFGMTREVPASPRVAPSRRLVYGAAAVSLVLAYFLAAGTAVRWASQQIGASIPSVIPAVGFVVFAVLVIVAVGRRGRHRLWVAIGRHLFGSKHDYGEVWIRLTELVSGARDASELMQRAAGFCRDLVCVPEVSMWLVDSSGSLWRVATASAGHVISEGRIGEEHAGSESGARVQSGNGSRAMTVADGTALAATTGASFACPMEIGGRVLGVLAIGSSTQPAKVDEEDRKLLRHIAAQVGSALGLCQLAEEIGDAREIASFNRLSTFILHGLKNLVVQQSFVLENAKKFAQNPAFLADALAAFEDSTDRMRSLIAKLRAPDPGTQSDSRPCDLVELLNELITMPRIALGADRIVRVVVPQHVRSCLVPADRSALAQVFSNLLVNAIESLETQNGEVTVAISPLDESWRIEVRDNGCGIPGAFIRTQLFRPFRTTKDKGLGIGLYQCKTIVEAAGGTISVASQENVGTTVAVTLPAQSTDSRKDNGVSVQNGQAHSSGC